MSSKRASRKAFTPEIHKLMEFYIPQWGLTKELERYIGISLTEIRREAVRMEIPTPDNPEECSVQGCLEPTVGNTIWCGYHYIRQISKTSGCWDVTDTFLTEAKKKFDDNPRCAYSGLPLVLGSNASMDHIIPINMRGGRDINNLDWVHKNVNNAKSTISQTAFLELIVRMHMYCSEFTSDDNVRALMKQYETTIREEYLHEGLQSRG